MASSRTGFTPPPDRRAEVNRQVVEELRSMSREQFAESTIEAGIYERDGRLAAPYRSDDPRPRKK